MFDTWYVSYDIEYLMNDIYDLLYKNVSIMMILYDHMQYLYINICAHGMIYIYIYAHTSTIYHTPWEGGSFNFQGSFVPQKRLWAEDGGSSDEKSFEYVSIHFEVVIWSQCASLLTCHGLPGNPTAVFGKDCGGPPGNWWNLLTKQKVVEQSQDPMGFTAFWNFNFWD